MTRRKHPPAPADPDDYGFDVAGKDFKVTTRELMQLLGVDPITCALYMRCLKPFADRFGNVQRASYYRFLQILRVIQSPAGGPRLDDVTKKQIRRALEWLVQQDLITCNFDANRRDRVLQIWVNKAPRRTTNGRVRAEVRA